MPLGEFGQLLIFFLIVDKLFITCSRIVDGFSVCSKAGGYEQLSTGYERFFSIEKVCGVMNISTML